MGVRKDGVTLVDEESGTAVDITGPLGSQLAADSVSVAIASDQLPLSVSSTPLSNTTVTQTLNVLNEEITIAVPDGYNSVTAILSANAATLALVFLQGTIAGGFTNFNPGFRLDTGVWIFQLSYTAATSRIVVSFPVVSGKDFTIAVGSYTSGSVDVELIASTALPLSTPLTNIELRASAVTVNTELPAAATITDNFANPSTSNIYSLGGIWDGATWDRQPGNSTDGTLVNLGTNNDVTVTGSVAITGVVTPSDNFANPINAVPTYGLNGLWDGLFWDRQPGNSTDGALVNLGTNNDIRVTDGTDTADVIPAGTGFGLQVHTSVKNGDALNLSDPLFIGGMLDDVSGVYARFVRTTTATIKSGLETVAHQGSPNTVTNSWPIKITDGVDTALVTTGAGLHTNLRDNSGNEINSGQLNSASITSTDRALETKSVIYLRNSDSTVTAWQPDGQYHAFMSNNYPWLKAMRSTFLSGDTTLGSLSAVLTIDVRERSYDSVAVFIRNSNLIGTIQFQTQPGGNAASIRVYNETTHQWEDGTLVNPTVDTLYRVPVSGIAVLNVVVTAYTSGSCLASYGAGPGVSATYAEVSGSSINSKCLVTTADEDLEFDEGDTESVSQTTEGYLRTINSGLVSDVTPSYIPSEVKPLSLTSEGRLRVSSVEARIPTAEELYGIGFSSTNNPWESASTPWGSI